MLFSEKELLEKFQFDSAGALKKCLRKQGIHYVLGKGNCVVTTEEAINAAMLGRVANDSPGSNTIDFK